MTPKPSALDADILKIDRNANAYALAVETGHYRAAARFAIAEVRRPAMDTAKWRRGARGAFLRRHA